MAASGATPIQIYYSTTASAVPTAGNLLPGELGLNIADMKLYCENSSGVVTLLASMTSPFAVLGNATAGAEIRLPEDTDNGSNYVALKAADSLASNVTFTLPNADGTNGQVIQTNGSGVLSFVSGASLATPLAVIGNATAGAEIRLPEDTDNGSNYVALKAPNSISANATLDVPSFQTSGSIGYLNVPRSGSAKTTSYTLAVSDVGQLIEIDTGGSIDVPDATFAAGDAVAIFNNTSGSITITCTITTAYIAGTDTDKASVSLATRGVATILFISSTVCVISGNVS